MSPAENRLPKMASSLLVVVFVVVQMAACQVIIPLQATADQDMLDPNLFQGDIELLNTQRVGRTISRQLWPIGSSGYPEVPYTIDASINQAVINNAINLWNSSTCLMFNPLPAGSTSRYINFTPSSSCASALGQTGTTGSQTIRLSPACQSSVGSVAHLIGHSLGILHEQSRVDKSNFVTVLFDNVLPIAPLSFATTPWPNYSIPYDYSSVMHFPHWAFTSNGNATLVANDVFAQGLIGSRRGLSFMDIKLANAMYNCTAVNLFNCGLFNDSCQNLGFLNTNCNCTCPPGTSGQFCQTLQSSYNSAINASLLANNKFLFSAGNVTTPNYPDSFVTDSRYTTVIAAPACSRINITFWDFSLLPRCSPTSLCCADSLAIGLQSGLLGSSWFCGTDIAPGTSFLSTGNTITLYYQNYAKNATNTNIRGFNATYTFLPTGCGNITQTALPNATTTSPTATTTTTTITSNITTAPAVTSTTTTTPTPTFPTTTTATATTTLPATTTTTPLTPTTAAPSTILTSSSVALQISGPTPCQYLFQSSTSLQFASPNFPLLYSNNQVCNVTLSTTYPRYMILKVSFIALEPGDAVTLKTSFGITRKFENSDSGKSFLVPSTSSNLTFVSDSASQNYGFLFDIVATTSPCQQIINVPVGGGGTLSFPASPYPQYTMCEWWITTDPAKKIKLTFSSFSVGTGTPPTLSGSDFVGADLTGDVFYQTNSVMMCGSTLPAPITSVGNKLNVMGYGFIGGQQGFTATYVAV